MPNGGVLKPESCGESGCGEAKGRGSSVYSKLNPVAAEFDKLREGELERDGEV